MSNPYYIPKDNSRMQNILALAGLAAQLYGLKQHGDIADTEATNAAEANRIKLQDVTQRGSEVDRRLTQEGRIADETNAVNVEQNRLKGEQVQNERAKIPYHQQNFGYGDESLAKIALKKVGISDNSPVAQQIHQFAADKNVTKADVWQSVRDSEEMQQAAIVDIQKKMESGVNKTPNYMDTKEGQQDYQILQQISTPEGWGQAVDAAFRNTAQSVKQTEANSKAETMKAQAEMGKNRYLQTDQGLYDTLEKKLVPDTGKLIPPEKAQVVGPGASLIEPGATTPSYTNPNRSEGKGFDSIDMGDRVKVMPRDGSAPYYEKKGQTPAQQGTIPTGGDLPPGVHGEAALGGLTTTQKETVKAIAEYRFPVSNLRNKEMMALVQRAYSYDPSFDAKEYAVRAKVRSDFTSGKGAANLRSLNTSVAHLDSLSKAANKLDNAPVQLWNTIANKGMSAVGDPRVTNFNTAATAVAGELANVFKNTSGTDQEIKAWRDNISSSQSPKQLKDSINTAIELLGGRLGALRSQYETGIGKPKDTRFLSDKSLGILTKLGVNIDTIDPIAGGVPATPDQNRRATDPRKVGRFTVEVE